MRVQVSNSVKQWFNTDHTHEGDCKQVAQFQTEANDFNNSLQGVEFENVDSVFVRAEGVKIDGVNKSVFISCGSFLEVVRAIEKENIKQGKAKDKASINAYINLSRHVSTLCKDIRCYPASYGIGVEVLWRDGYDNAAKVRKVLDGLGIEYTNNHSLQRWVYRFNISKSKANIKRLQALA